MIKFRDAVRIAGYEQMSCNHRSFGYEIDYQNRIIHLWRKDRPKDISQVFFENVLYIELAASVKENVEQG